jgi:hypothetical protein
MEKKNFLFVSLTGLISDIAWQVLDRRQPTLQSNTPENGAVLALEGYFGYIDVNCIVNNHGIYSLEFTSRFGYPTISIQQSGMLTPIGQFFLDLADGNDPKLKRAAGFKLVCALRFRLMMMKRSTPFRKDSVIVFKKPPQDEIHIEDESRTYSSLSCITARILATAGWKTPIACTPGAICASGQAPGDPRKTRGIS